MKRHATQELADAAAFVGYALFLLDAFGVRTLRRRRSKGSAGWHRPSSPADLMGESLWVAGCGATAAAPLLALANAARPNRAPLRATAGLAVLAGGIAAALVAQRQLGDEWKPSADPGRCSELVAEGAFGVVRHPFYVGCALSSVGMGLVVPGPVSFAGVVAVVAGAEVVVRLVEEPALRRAHGGAYDRYIQRTGRFLPRIPRRTTHAQGA